MGTPRRLQAARSTATAVAPDSLLVARSRHDPHAFVALYDRYFPAVYGYCLGELRDPEAAEDAAAQTFLKALAAIPGYRDTGRFRPWLFAIAHNTLLDTIGRRRPQAPLEAAAGLPDPAATPEERAILAADLARLDAAIARLPPDDRRVLELRRAGLNGPEIAATLGIGHEAAKKRQLRAIDRVRAELAATPGEWGVLRGS